MKIAIITAMPEETRAIIRVLGRMNKMRMGHQVVYQGRTASHDLTVIEAGMGFANAETAARLIIGELRPDLIVSAGFCGGILEGLQVGDAVVATGLAIVSESGLEVVRVTIPEACRDFVSRQAAEGRRVFGGLFATTTVIIPKMRLAALLPPDVQFPVVEMESAAIAVLAGENGIPFAGLRTVSDPFNEELGFSLDEFCDDTMRIRIPKVLLTVARKPRIIPQLIRLAGNSRVAAASLSQAFMRFMAVNISRR
jgi:adenosylhomocysteine nucleosidase